MTKRLSSIISDLAKSKRAVSKETRAAAEQALKRMAEYPEEDVEVWADRLASDLAKFND